MSDALTQAKRDEEIYKEKLAAGIIRENGHPKKCSCDRCLREDELENLRALKKEFVTVFSKLVNESYIFMGSGCQNLERWFQSLNNARDLLAKSLTPTEVLSVLRDK